MTRSEAAAFVEALDGQSANDLGYAARNFADALGMVAACTASRRDHWKLLAGAARERLITALCGEEPTQPLAGSDR